MGLESVDDLINDLDQALQHACEYDQMLLLVMKFV